MGFLPLLFLVALNGLYSFVVSGCLFVDSKKQKHKNRITQKHIKKEIFDKNYL
jgi:hypothetical protein